MLKQIFTCKWSVCTYACTCISYMHINTLTFLNICVIILKRGGGVQNVDRSQHRWNREIQEEDHTQTTTFPSDILDEIPWETMSNNVCYKGGYFIIENWGKILRVWSSL